MPETHSNNSEVEGEVRGDQTAVEELVNKLDVLNVTSEKGQEIQTSNVETVLQSLTLVDKNEENDEDVGVYTSKGPVRGKVSGVSARDQVPYQKDTKVCAEDTYVIGEFQDRLFHDLAFDSLSFPIVEDLDPLQGEEQKGEDVLDRLDDLFGINESTARIIVRNDCDPNGVSILPAPVHVMLDEKREQIGVKIPKTTIPTAVMNGIATGWNQLEIFVQLDPTVKRFIKAMAETEMMMPDGQGKQIWSLKRQIILVQPFQHDLGFQDLLMGISDTEIQAAFDLVNSKSSSSLLELHGPNQDTTLMILTTYNDSTKNRAQIYAFVKRLLCEVNPKHRKNIVMRNGIDMTALDYACLFQKPKCVRFLASVFYVLGQNLMSSDPVGNNILHLLARKGDEVADCLEKLLHISYSNNEKAFSSQIANKNGELPLHIAVMNSRCQHRTLMHFANDFRQGFTSMTKNGDMPIHIACQLSKDPTLIASLLHYNASVVNSKRLDGMTPLHLVASRSDEEDRKAKFMSLDEETQARIVRLLIDHGADKTQRLEGFSPFQLALKERTKVRVLLKVKASSTNTKQASLSTTKDNSPSNLQNNVNYTSYSNPGSTSTLTETQSFEETGSSPGFYDQSPTGAFAESASSGSGPEIGTSDSEEELDAIAALLVQHPAIRQVLDVNERESNPV